MVRPLLVLSMLTFASATPGCKNNPIGGECRAAMDCAKGAERCFKMAGATEGVCSKQCTADDECGALAICQRIEVTRTGGVYGKDGTTGKERWCLPKGAGGEDDDDEKPAKKKK